MAMPSVLRITLRVKCRVTGLESVKTYTERAATLHLMDDCLCTVVIQGHPTGRVYPVRDIIRTELFYPA